MATPFVNRDQLFYSLERIKKFGALKREKKRSFHQTFFSQS